MSNKNINDGLIIPGAEPVIQVVRASGTMQMRMSRTGGKDSFKLSNS
jgi:hypothetical protein